MQLYLNSCILDEIKEINEWGILDGVTMNPTMVAKFGGDYVANFKAICKMVTCPVFAQVVSTDKKGIIEEAKKMNSLGDKVIVKIHTNIEGIKAITALKDSTDIKICATSIHSVIEAMTVARAGADHAAIFLGLLGEADEHSTTELIKGVVELYRHAEGCQTKIMTAGRSLRQIVEGFKLGADEMTASPAMWKMFLDNSFSKGPLELLHQGLEGQIRRTELDYGLKA